IRTRGAAGTLATPPDRERCARRGRPSGSSESSAGRNAALGQDSPGRHGCTRSRGRVSGRTRLARTRRLTTRAPLAPRRFGYGGARVVLRKALMGVLLALVLAGPAASQRATKTLLM